MRNEEGGKKVQEPNELGTNRQQPPGGQTPQHRSERENENLGTGQRREEQTPRQKENIQQDEDEDEGNPNE